MKTVEVKDASRQQMQRTGQLAWLWTHVGDGAIYPVDYYSDKGWVVCRREPNGSPFSTVSFRVVSSTPCYVFDSDDERMQFLTDMQARLKAFRENASRAAEEKWQEIIAGRVS